MKLKKSHYGAIGAYTVLMIFVVVTNPHTGKGGFIETGPPLIESIGIFGYDARDLNELKAHDGITMLKNSAGIQNNAKEKDERIVIYLENRSVQPVTIYEVKLAGIVYNFQDNVRAIDNYDGTAPGQGNYVILTDGTSGLLQSSAELQPGQIASVVLDITHLLKIGRVSHFQITTSNGSVFVGSIVNGQQG